MARCRRILRVLTGVVAGLAAASPRATAQPRTLVFVNETPTLAWFNDGDTMQLGSGPFAGRAARIGDINTLESYGPVHEWPGFTPRELWVLAKQATLLSRRGTWHCTIEAQATDAYDRLLARCPDLAAALVQRGLAHTYSLEGSAPEKLRAEQRAAMVAGRGIWAHGVPPLLVTSAHSTAERLARASAYDRWVSSTDGMARAQPHRRRYARCARACAPRVALTSAARSAAVAALRRSPTTAAIVRDLPAPILDAALDELATTARLPTLVPDPAQRRLHGVLEHLRADPTQWRTEARPGTCLVYVPPALRFERGFVCPAGER